MKTQTELIESQAFSAALLLIYQLKPIPKYSTISELSFLMDKQTLINFLNYYGGQSIKIPTIEEVTATLRTLSLYQYYVIDKYPWKESLKMVGLDPSSNKDSRAAERRLTTLKKLLEEYKIDGELYNL